MESESCQEDWAVYFSTVNEDQIGSTVVDLGFAGIAPIQSKLQLTTFTIFMKNPTEDGLSSAEESDLLNQIEDDFIELIVGQLDAVYVGRLKYDGKILSYFYSKNIEGIEDIFARTEQKYPNYRFEHGSKEEKDWRAYFEVLYPSPFEMQVIQNGRVVENLEKQGDTLEKEREVEHWIYFKTESEREHFLVSIKDDGFEIVEKDTTNSSQLPFSLQISRVDKVDYENIHEYVLYLWQKAQEFNGDYDGWETSVVKG
jgi:uncharacterized protein (TIGR01619 family)